MQVDRESEIRNKAYEKWESEGRRDGDHERGHAQPVRSTGGEGGGEGAGDRRPPRVRALRAQPCAAWYASSITEPQYGPYMTPGCEL